MVRAALLLAVLLSAGTVHAGTVTGRVRAEGKLVPGETVKGGKYESRRLKFAERVDYRNMKDFVVYLDQTLPDLPEPETPRVVQAVIQKNATFDPHVLPVMVGTTVEWPNLDTIYHNVFSYSEPKPFDLGLYKDEIKRITFDKVGRVDVFCSIHKNMNCIVLVLPSPYFASTDDHGRYEIRDVPAGTYQFKAWGKRLPPQTLEVVVPETGEVQVDFSLGITGIPKY